MDKTAGLSRRRLMRVSLIGGAGFTALAALAGCGGTQIVEKEVVKIVTKEVPVDRVVTQIVEKEKIVTQIVEKVVEKIVEVEKEKIVEKIVTVEAAQAKRAAVTLMFNTWYGTTEEYNAEVFDPFTKKFPHVTIDAAVTPWVQYWQKMQTQAVGGGLPDFFGMDIGYKWDWANKGLLMNMAPLIKRDLDESKYNTTSWATAKFPTDNSVDQYMMPQEVVTTLLYYNEELLDAAGVEHPTYDWSYKTLEEAAMKLIKRDGDKISQYGYYGSGTYHAIMDPMVKSNGGQVLSEDFKQCLLNKPKSVEMIQLVVDWIEKGVSPNPVEAAALAGGGSFFATKKVGMEITGSWNVDAFIKSTDLPFNVSMVPTGNVKRVVYGAPDSWSISSATPNFEDAWEMVMFGIGEERSYENFPLGRVPILKSIGEDPAFNKKGRVSGYKAMLESEPYMSGSDFGPSFSEWRNAWANNLQLAFLGEETSQAAADSATKAIQDILDKVIWPATAG